MKSFLSDSDVIPSQPDSVQFSNFISQLLSVLPANLKWLFSDFSIDEQQETLVTFADSLDDLECMVKGTPEVIVLVSRSGEFRCDAATIQYVDNSPLISIGNARYAVRAVSNWSECKTLAWSQPSMCWFQYAQNSIPIPAAFQLGSPNMLVLELILPGEAPVTPNMANCSSVDWNPDIVLMTGVGAPYSSIVRVHGLGIMGAAGASSSETKTLGLNGTVMDCSYVNMGNIVPAVVQPVSAKSTLRGMTVVLQGKGLTTSNILACRNVRGIALHLYIKMDENMDTPETVDIFKALAAVFDSKVCLRTFFIDANFPSSLSFCDRTKTLIPHASKMLEKLKESAMELRELRFHGFTALGLSSLVLPKGCFACVPI